MGIDEIIRMAREAGFEEYDCGLSGNSELDEMLYVGEYPIGEAVFKFAALVAEAKKAEYEKKFDEVFGELIEKIKGGMSAEAAIRSLK